MVCRKTLFQCIEREFAEMKENLTSTLQKVINVCKTLDLWTAYKRIVFGMTCHWIKEDYGVYGGSIGLCMSERRAYLKSVKYVQSTKYHTK